MKNIFLLKYIDRGGPGGFILVYWCPRPASPRGPGVLYSLTRAPARPRPPPPRLPAPTLTEPLTDPARPLSGSQHPPPQIKKNGAELYHQEPREDGPPAHRPKGPCSKSLVRGPLCMEAGCVVSTPRVVVERRLRCTQLL